MSPITTDRRPVESLVRIGPGPRALDGRLAVPPLPVGIAVLLPGDAGIPHSPPPAELATTLCAAGLATLELHLLTREELAEDVFTRHLRFDVRLQAARLAGALAWLRAQPWAEGLAAGCFATGAAGAAALIAAATNPGAIEAVALWGGRPDLAGRELARVGAPALLLVEPHNEPLLELNRAAAALLAAGELIAPADPAELAPRVAGWLARRLDPARRDDARPLERAVGGL